MIGLGYVKQGTKSKFIFIDYYKTTRASLGIVIKEFFHSRPLYISFFHPNTDRNDTVGRLL